MKPSARAARAAMIGIFLAQVAGFPALAAAAPNDRSAVGVNVTRVNYYERNWMFVDLVKYFAGDWGEGSGTFTLDPDGWPATLSGGPIGSGVAWVGTGRSPSNTFALLWDGDGDVRPAGNTITTLTTAAGRITFKIGNPEGGLGVTITRVNAANHLRNIRLVPIEYEGTYQSQPFHPVFLEQMKKFRVLRFMDVMATNNATSNAPTTWANRAKPTDAVQGHQNNYHEDKGVALEYLIQLANTLHADPWLNIPHSADDDYLHNFARVVAQQLDPSLKFYIEYSNEIWNFANQQNYCGAQGQAAHTDYPASYTDPLSHVHRSGDGSVVSCAFGYQGHRSRQIFDIFDQELQAAGQNPRTRYVRVIASQIGWTDRIEFTLDMPLSDGSIVYQHADALATAPYFGFPPDNIPAGSVTAAAAVGWCANSLPSTVAAMKRDELTARQRGLMYLAYEGGQSLDDPGGAQADISAMAAANRDPQMGTLYGQMLDGWKAAGVNARVNVIYNAQYSPGEWGMWGLLEFQGQDSAATGITQPPAPKYDAVMGWIDDNPCWWAGCNGGGVPGDVTPPASPRQLRAR